MALDRINPSALPRTSVVERFNETQKRDDARSRTDAAGTGIPAPAPEKTEDRAEISETARRLMEIRMTVDLGLEALADLPEVRDAKVAEARQRLAQGYYNSLQVTEDVAGKLDRTFGAIDEL